MSKIKFGQMVTCMAFLTRRIEFLPDARHEYKKIWAPDRLKDPETCVAIAMVTLSNGLRIYNGPDEGYGYKPTEYVRALKIGLRTGGTRYARIEDINPDHLPFTGEETCPAIK